MRDTNVLRYGSPDPLPEQISLRAGALSMLFENGDLRHVCLGDHEIVNRVYVAVRDHNWRTIAPKLTLTHMDVKADSFDIAFDVENQQGEIDFFWQGIITGMENTLVFTMIGEARSTFWRNRIGFCVLHPMALAGRACRIRHQDGRESESQFPQFIAPQHRVNGQPAPHYPFVDIRSLKFQVQDGVQATLRFEGESFETEDQRNWTDGSYKTYGTPIQAPFPVEVQAGTRIEQRVMLNLSGHPSAETIHSSKAGVVNISPINDAQAFALPRIGLGTASHGQPLNGQEIERLKRLNLSHVRVDLRLLDDSYEDTLRRAADDARALGVPLEIALLFTNRDELRAFVGLINEVQPRVVRWLIFDAKGTASPSEQLWLARHLTPYDPSVPFGGGTNVDFVELNRARPSADLIDFTVYSANPQVHAFDNLSIMESPAALPVTVATARDFSGKPVVVSPITLKRRSNPDATQPDSSLPPDQLPPAVDPRQMSLFCAAWTLAMLKYLGESGVDAVTLFETTGWRGVMETTAGSPLPDLFPSLPGEVFPVYHILADVGAFADSLVMPTVSSAPLRVVSLMLSQSDQMCVLLANLTHERQEVVLNVPGYRGTLRTLDETNAEGAMREPEAFRERAGEPLDTLACELLPYAIARIDFTAV